MFRGWSSKVLLVSFLTVVLGIAVGIGVYAGTLIYGMGGTFPNLDPNATTLTEVSRITLHIVEPLVFEPQLGTFEPALATSWSVNEDASEYTFELRRGVTFSDGTPFNAAAVKFTFDRIVDPKTKSQTAFSLIGPYAGTEIINDYEVKVKFSSPFAAFMDSVASPCLGIISPTAFQRIGAANWGVTALVGTGPFQAFDSGFAHGSRKCA